MFRGDFAADVDFDLAFFGGIIGLLGVVAGGFGLGGNDDDAAGAAHAVDGGGAVFDDVDGGDVIRVDHAGVEDFGAIVEDQRLGVALVGRHAADDEVAEFVERHTRGVRNHIFFKGCITGPVGVGHVDVTDGPGLTGDHGVGSVHIPFRRGRRLRSTAAVDRHNKNGEKGESDSPFHITKIKKRAAKMVALLSNQSVDYSAWL